MEKDIKNSRFRLNSMTTCIVGILLALLFIIPPLREITLLNLRLLFHINRNTKVRGVVRGCSFYNFPNVVLAESKAEELCAEAYQRPESFVLAMVFKDDLLLPSEGGLLLPPPDFWRGQKLATWAAVIYSNRCRDEREEYKLFEYGYLSHQDRDEETASRIEPALAVVREAQEVDPQNGALWVCQAHLLFCQGKNQEALECLTTASERPSWRTGVDTESRLIFDSLRDSGLPRLDAVRSIHSTYAYASTFFSMVLRSVHSHLTWLMAQAVKAEDRTEFARLLSLRARLGQATLQDGPANEFPINQFSVCPEKEALFEQISIALRQGKVEPFDPKEYSKWNAERRQSCFFQLICEYLEIAPTTSLGKELEKQYEESHRHIASMREANDANYSKMMPMFVWSILTGVASFCLFTACMIIIYFLPWFRWTNLFDSVRSKSGRLAFGLIIFFGALTAMTTLSFLESVGQPVGFSLKENWYLINNFGDKVLASAICGFSLTYVILWFQPRHRVRWSWIRRFFLIFFCGCFVATCFAGYFREQLLVALLNY